MHMEKKSEFHIQNNGLHAFSGVVSWGFHYISSKLRSSEKNESNARNNKENKKIENIIMLSWKCMMHWCLEYCMQLDYNAVKLWKNWENSREKQLLWLKPGFLQSGQETVDRKKDRHLYIIKKGKRGKRKTVINSLLQEVWNIKLNKNSDRKQMWRLGCFSSFVTIWSYV